MEHGNNTNPPGMVGGPGRSIRRYMPRHRLLEGMQDLRLPSALIDIVMCWHQQAHYHINHDGIDRVIHATQGVRQVALLRASYG